MAWPYLSPRREATGALPHLTERSQRYGPTITGKNLEINDTIRKYVEKKIGRLDRYLPNIIDGPSN